MRIDAYAALDQAADARPLMAMLVGAAAGRKGNAVAAHQQLALRHCLEKRGELFMRDHAGRIGGRAALVAARELPAPAGDAAGAGFTMMAVSPCQASPSLSVAPAILAEPCTMKMNRGSGGSRNSTFSALESTSSYSRIVGCIHHPFAAYVCFWPIADIVIKLSR